MELLTLIVGSLLGLALIFGYIYLMIRLPGLAMAIFHLVGFALFGLLAWGGWEIMQFSPLIAGLPMLVIGVLGLVGMMLILCRDLGLAISGEME